MRSRPLLPARALAEGQEGGQGGEEVEEEGEPGGEGRRGLGGIRRVLFVCLCLCQFVFIQLF